MTQHIPNRKLDIGIIQVSFLVFIQAFYALTIYLESLSQGFEAAKTIIYQATYAYVYISVLMLIRKILSNDKILYNNVLWIIRLEVIKAIGNVLLAIGVYFAAIFVLASNLVLAVFYILSMVRIFSDKHTERSEITQLGPVMISLVSCFIVATLGGWYASFDRVKDIYGITNLIMAIPFILLILYFKGLKNKQLSVNI
jgi:hypothetical protein